VWLRISEHYSGSHYTISNVWISAYSYQSIYNTGTELTGWKQIHVWCYTCHTLFQHTIHSAGQVAVHTDIWKWKAILGPDLHSPSITSQLCILFKTGRRTSSTLLWPHPILSWANLEHCGSGNKSVNVSSAVTRTS